MYIYYYQYRQNECIKFYGIFEKKSTMMLLERRANLKYKLGNKNFWAVGYYISTVVLNEATIKKYIQEQEKEDQIEYKMMKKEHKTLLKGS